MRFVQFNNLKVFFQSTKLVKTFVFKELNFKTDFSDLRKRRSGFFVFYFFFIFSKSTNVKHVCFLSRNERNDVKVLCSDSELFEIDKINKISEWQQLAQELLCFNEDEIYDNS